MITVLTLATALALPSDTVLLIAGVEIPLVYIEAGHFEREITPKARQRVILTEPFWLGRYEVTRAEWAAVMGQRDGPRQPRHPVRNVSWLEVAEFLERASAAVDGWAFRLPTEAEWEYAARAGSKTEWASGSDSLRLLDYAWVRANAGGAVQEVGSRLPNGWGLYDMHGNVWEWVADWMGPYPETAMVTDPTGPARGTERVRRGGSAVYNATAARSSYRYQQPPDRGNGNLGFRIVATRTTRGAS